MISLLDLPVERLLGVLSPAELAPCTRLSKRFRSIIRTSSFLTYILELGKAGLEKPYFMSYDQLENSESNSSNLLAALRRRELGLSKFAWNEQWDISVRKRYNFWEVCGSVLAAGFASHNEDPNNDGFGTFSAIDIYDFCDLKSRKVPKATLFFDKHYDSYAIDPGQDLLILVEGYTSPDRYHKLHIRSLSTGHHYGYVELNQHTISIPVPDDEDDDEESDYYIGICGDIIIFPHSRNLTVIKWKTGQFLTIDLDFDPGTACRLISEREFLTVGHRGKGPFLDYYTLRESEVSTESMDRVVFSLPFTDNQTPVEIVWQPVPSFSEPICTPKIFSPFVQPSAPLYPPKAQLIHIQFISDSIPEREENYPEPFDMFVHVDRLRHVKNTYKFNSYSSSSTHAPVIPIIPWDVWGPDTTRVFDRIILEWEYNSIRGHRALVAYGDFVRAIFFGF